MIAGAPLQGTATSSKEMVPILLGANEEKCAKI